jgi:putative membrane protein
MDMILEKIKSKYPILLFSFLIVFWIIMGINPVKPKMFIIESILLIILVLLLVLTYKKFKFKNFTYTILFIFAILQIIGGHYTYSNVPFDWFTNFFNFERNHYDRVIHFLFGLIFSIAYRELYIKTTGDKGFWSYLIPIEMAFATGSIYEIIEWMYAIVAEPANAEAYLGLQGDVWDAHKDMFLAGIGSIISMSSIFLFKFFRKYKND